MARAWRITLLLVAWSSMVPLADAQLPPGGDKPKSDKAKLEIELPNDPNASRVPLTPEEVVQSLIPDLRLYPDEAAMAAIDRLALSGDLVVKPLRHVLTGQEFTPRLAAAAALAEIGDKGALPAIERLITNKQAKKHIDTLYDLVERIDPERAVAVAMVHARGKNSAASSAAMRYLRRRGSADLEERLLELLDCSRWRVRLEAFELLQQSESTAVIDAAFELLGDSGSKVAENASSYLQLRRTDEIKERLLSLADEDPPSRQALWAVLTLSEIEEHHDEPVFVEEQADLFERRLGSLEPLVKLSSAFALYDILRRSEREDASLVISGEVLPAIMETFLQSAHFKDFNPLFTMARPRVERMTGVELGNDLPTWRKAWLGQGTKPLLRSDLPTHLLMESLDEVVVRYESHRVGPEVARRVVTISGEGHLLDDSPPADDTLFVTDASMQELIDALSDTGLLDRTRRLEREERDDSRVIRVRLGSRERTVIAHRLGDPSFDAAERLILRVAQEQAWQRLHLGEAAAFPGFYELEKQRFGSASAEEWDRSYAHLVQVALPTLTSGERMAALEVLLQRPSLVERVGEPELLNLLAGLESEPYPEGPVTVLVEVVLRKRSPELRAPTLDFLTRRFGSQADELVGRLLWDSESVRYGASHENADVRRVAMKVAPYRRPVHPAVLTAGLDDRDARVRREAMLAMGRADDPATRTRLLSLARGEVPGLHNVALEAVGATGSPEALRTLITAARESTDRERRSALSGLASMGGVPATTALREFAEGMEYDIGDRVEAVAALGRSGDAYAVEELARLLGSDRIELREEAACQLAAIGDMRAVPVLIELLEHPARAPRALDFLSILFSSDGGAAGEEFENLHEASPFFTHMDWFEKALAEAGFPTSGDKLQGIPFEALTGAIEQGRWFLRHNAVKVLEREYGVSFGVPYRFASAEEVDRIAARWRGYLAASAVTGSGT